MAFNKDPLAAGNDRDIIEYSNDLENRISESEKPTQLSITGLNGFTTNELIFVRVGNIIFLQGYTRGNLPSGSAFTSLLQLPPDIRPIGGTLYSATISGNFFAQVQINSDSGQVQARQTSISAGANWVGLDIVFVID